MITKRYERLLAYKVCLMRTSTHVIDPESINDSDYHKWTNEFSFYMLERITLIRQYSFNYQHLIDITLHFR